jgi:hypothetical protein
MRDLQLDESVPWNSFGEKVKPTAREESKGSWKVEKER